MNGKAGLINYDGNGPFTSKTTIKQKNQTGEKKEKLL